MKLKSLYSEIEELGRQRYHLNDLHRHGTYILKYNKKKRIWEYYDVNGRLVNAENYKGMLIRRTIYTDGTCSAAKLVK